MPGRFVLCGFELISGYLNFKVNLAIFSYFFECVREYFSFHKRMGDSGGAVFLSVLLPYDLKMNPKGLSVSLFLIRDTIEYPELYINLWFYPL